MISVSLHETSLGGTSLVSMLMEFLKLKLNESQSLQHLPTAFGTIWSCRESGIVMYNMVKSSWVLFPLMSSLCQIAAFLVCMFGMQSELIRRNCMEAVCIVLNTSLNLKKYSHITSGHLLRWNLTSWWLPELISQVPVRHFGSWQEVLIWCCLQWYLGIELPSLLHFISLGGFWEAPVNS